MTSFARWWPKTSRPGVSAVRSRRGFRRSPTVIRTSATSSRSASTSASRASSTAAATCGSTTRIPSTEDIKYVEAIKNDIKWLGFEWDAELYASDYFGKLYEFAELLVKKGTAYVDSQTTQQIRENRGTVTVPGTNSPHRDRSVDENLDLLAAHEGGRVP